MIYSKVLYEGKEFHVDTCTKCKRLYNIAYDNTHAYLDKLEIKSARINLCSKKI